MNRKAEMGVGTLIIFISLLLVAAVAAGVLIQTAGGLQQKALSTGTQATGQISTNAVALEVSATDGSDGNLENYTAIFKLAPGSDPIKLDDLTITLASKNTSQTFTYDNSSANGNTSSFGVNFVQTGSTHQDGVVVRGDVAEINFVGTRSFEESEHLRISAIPKIGVTTVVEFDQPDVISTQRAYLYP